VKPRLFRVTPAFLAKVDHPLNPAASIFLERFVIVDEENSPVVLYTLKDGFELLLYEEARKVLFVINPACAVECK
jgi:hypothetical protein